MKLLTIAASLGALFAGQAAFAQSTDRIIMRRPLNQHAAPVSTPTPACGTPGGPECPPPPPPPTPYQAQCQFASPMWRTGAENVCSGSTVVATNVSCYAYPVTNGSVGTTMVSVPDSVCLEDEASYQRRCGSVGG